MNIPLDFFPVKGYHRDMYRTLPREGLPIYRSGTNGHAVLLIHGYTGRPAEMEYLGTVLHEGGFTVAVPRLPGHATSREDLLKCTWRDWYRRVLDAYCDLAGTHETVSAAGLSMGGLLAILLASQVSCRSISLAAPALITTRQKLLAVTPAARYILPSRRHTKSPSQAEDSEIAYLEEEYYHWTMPLPLSHLRVLQRKAKRVLRDITTPVSIIVSKQDASVPVESGRIIYNRISSSKKELLVYEQSPHVIVNACEKERAASDILRWIRSQLPHK